MPLFDVALLSVFTVCLYLGVTVLRRYGGVATTFGSMLLLDAALAGVAIAARLLSEDGGGEIAGVIGVVSVGGGICLVAVPPILRELARRALLRDYLRVARSLVDLRELLQPGMGSAQERELIDTIIAVRGGRTSEAIDLMREARGELDPRARRRLDERIIMTYLYARQWPEAIEQYERLTQGGAQSASLQLLVEMVRAYCESDDLESASELVAHLEASEIRDDPSLSFLLNRSRLVFLAFVGRTGAVERLAGPRGPLGGMPKEAGAFWSGLARHNAGDRAGAVASLRSAVRYSSRDKRARELASVALKRAEEGSGEPRPVPADVASLADMLTEVVLAAPPAPKRSKAGPPRLVGVAISRVPVTSTLVAMNLIAAAAIWLIFGSTADIGALVRAGANVKAGTLGGQYWRWISHQFVHVGLLHLAINGYGLWVLGKITEQLYGSRRLLFLYVAAGFAGGVASTLSGPATSAGASGAIFGLLGATLIELTLHRRKYPQSWTRSLTGLLLLLTVINIAVGFAYPMIDQAAHLGGLAVGGVFGFLLSRNTRWAKLKIVRGSASVLAAIAAVAILWAGFGLLTDGYGMAVAREARQTRAFPGEAQATLPQSWESGGGGAYLDEARLVRMTLRAEAATGPVSDALVREVHAEQYESAREQGFQSARRADPEIGAPEPWRSHELVVSADEVGGEQTFRVLVFARRLQGKLVLGSIYVRAAVAAELRPLIHEIITSIALKGPTSAP